MNYPKKLLVALAAALAQVAMKASPKLSPAAGSPMGGTRRVTGAFLGAALLFCAAAWGQSKNLAPGFSSPPKSATVAVMPADIELFSMSGGGVLEPKADWTELGAKHFKAALLAKNQKLGLRSVEVAEKYADEFAEINALHAAVARSIALHQFGASPLPTKEGKLDWSLGDAVHPVKQATGADYALFSWVRDSYTSSERAAAMIGLAFLGIGVPGGRQIGYASLVDLNTGQVVWFNRLDRASGDLREADKAAETVDTLLADFPVPK